MIYILWRYGKEPKVTEWHFSRMQETALGFHTVMHLIQYFVMPMNWKCFPLVKGKVIPVTGREDPYGFETSELPYFLNNRLTDGGEVVGLTRRPPFFPRKIPGTHFCWRLSRPQNHSAAGRIRSIEKSNDLIWSRTRDLPACSIVPQPIRYRVPPFLFSTITQFQLFIFNKENFAMRLFHFDQSLT
jgi:hypothetical protein